MELTQFRTCHLKIWHLGILSILSWRSLRNGLWRTLWPSPLKLVIKHPHVRGILPIRKRPYLQDGRSQRGSRTRRPCFPGLLTLSSYPLSYHIFSQLCTLHQMSHTNTQVYFFRSSFPMKVPMSHTTCKKSLCPFLFLSFVTGAPAKNFEEWRSHSSKA